MKRLFLLLLCLALSSVVNAQDSVKTEVMKEGRGEPIKLDDKAVIAYTLTLDSGEVLEKKDALKPLKFVVGGQDVIPGISQGVVGMKVGELRKVVVPPSLGYGESGPFPSDANLNFEIELLEIRPLVAVPEPGEDDDEPLAVKMKRDQFLAKRNARDISKPAIFEFLIRDFFTKPWRYADGHIEIWKDSAKLLLPLILLSFLAVWGKKKGWLMP